MNNQSTSSYIADILTPVALDTAYSYAVPEGMALAVGDVVHVPFGPRETTGVVWDIREATSGGPSNLKSIKAKADAPPVPEPLRHFIDWVARYTLAPRGSVVRMALRGPEIDRPERVQIGVRLLGPPPKRLTPGRARVMAAAEGGLLYSKRALSDLAGVGVSVIDSLIDEGG